MKNDQSQCIARLTIGHVHGTKLERVHVIDDPCRIAQGTSTLYTAGFQVESIADGVVLKLFKFFYTKMQKAKHLDSTFWFCHLKLEQSSRVKPCATLPRLGFWLSSRDFPRGEARKFVSLDS